ncbi:hypothetical protein ABI_15200 [Asticcacaulis biprosthecium C19]|uniref:Uncharacterized protein n=1 Tax=Asticcacaulis biprosthecium C19 TaxID=715226 RepID=F4QJ17_9CAUL|nr:hypothetical protein [Asticcacaulis biprosthecium]EGF93080.1 hypothetical protein ABI_15200 [Asticcacaulis biprosthecium C19]
MSRKIYQFCSRLCVAESFEDAARIMGVPAGHGFQIFDMTPVLKALCESVLGPDTFAPPSKPIFFGAGAQDRTYMHALGACGVVTGTKEAIDEVARLVKLEADHAEQSTWLHDELAAAQARVAELENAAKETNDRLVWQAEKQAMALETPAPVPVTIDATPRKPGRVGRDWTDIDKILHRDYPADVNFEVIHSRVVATGSDIDRATLRNRITVLKLNRTNASALKAANLPKPQEPKASLSPESSGITPPATASRLAKLIGAEALRMSGQLLNPDEIAAELNAALGRNDQVTAKQVTQVLAEMSRLKRDQQGTAA